MHVIPADLVLEEIDATIVLKELEETGGDAGVVRLVRLTRTEHVEEPEADSWRLEALDVRLHPAVEQKLRIAVRVERPLAGGIVHPADAAAAVQGGTGGVDHRDASELPECQPFARVLEVVAQH